MGQSETLEASVARHLLERRWTVAVAESCTGGLVAYRLTSVPGSSAYFRGGIVAYAPDVKETLVGVPREVLDRCGVVSAETAIALARGARRVLRADIGIGVTGYAGPDGGTSQAPIGTVYIGLAGPEGEAVRRCFWKQDREGIRQATAETVCIMLKNLLKRDDHRENVQPSPRSSKP